VALELTPRHDLRLTSLESTVRPEFKPAAGAGTRTSRSWLGWLTGKNRRRESTDRLVQGELLLRQVRPMRNDFRDESGGGRRNPKLLYETPPAPERRDDQDHAWNRLRNRRPQSLVVPGE
jgi:hypothetical protein